MLRRTCKSRYPTAAMKRERYRDCHGIAFDEYRMCLPDDVREWPQIKRVQDWEVEKKMHQWFGSCWNCGDGSFHLPLECHHIIGGTKGRSDELCNIAMLGQSCHANANTNKLPMGRVLFLKWEWDRLHTDWVRIALLHRKHLPDLITE